MLHIGDKPEYNKKGKIKIWVKAPSYDKCPQCKLHFMKKKVVQVWKDFVECHNCGHMWVLQSEKAYERFCGKLEDPDKKRALERFEEPLGENHQYSPSYQ